jgi:hypothetical protein
MRFSLRRKRPIARLDCTAGIHVRSNCDVGLTMGRQVAEVVWARVRIDAA